MMHLDEFAPNKEIFFGVQPVLSAGVGAAAAAAALGGRGAPGLVIAVDAGRSIMGLQRGDVGQHGSCTIQSR